MIRNETEYQEAAARLSEERIRLTAHCDRLREAGLSDVEIKRVIDPMEVSRDERNEYYGITLERAVRILDALNVRLHSKVEIEPLRRLAVA